MKVDLFCCLWIFRAVLRPDLFFPPLCSLLYSHLWLSHGALASTNSCQVISNGDDGGGFIGKDNLRIPSLFPPFDHFVNIRLPCLVWSLVQNIWRGAVLSFLQQCCYVCINGINSWEIIFLFSVHRICGWTEILAEVTQSITEKVVWKKEHFDAQMAPNKGVCSVTSRICCDVMSSKCILGYQTKSVRNQWFEMLNMFPVLKASPWYPAKCQLIRRLPYEIAWPWELLESGFTAFHQIIPSGQEAWHSVPGRSALISFCSHKVNSWAVSYYKYASFSFLHLSRKLYIHRVLTLNVHFVPEALA